VIGAEALGLLFAGWLARAGQDVALIDGDEYVVASIEKEGVLLIDLEGVARPVPVRATTDAATVGAVDLALVFVRYYETAAAIEEARPLLGVGTTVLTLQPGWGDAEQIAELVGRERVLAGTTQHVAWSLGYGRVSHQRPGTTLIGELDGRLTGRLDRVVGLFKLAGIDTAATAEVRRAIWSRLALEACALPVMTLLKYPPGHLLEHDGTLKLMRGLLGETVAAARAQGLALDEEERRAALLGALERGEWAWNPMRHDLDTRQRTDVDVLNGAVVAAGRRAGLPTPYHEAMLWLIRAQERRDDGVQ
jgi:2-dehydropantoate 2-reductase